MRKIIPIILFAIATMVSCSTLDCPLNNTVYTKYKLDGNVTQLTGSYMTISTNKQDGEDSILINKDENVDSFMLPMSYTNAADTLYFEIQDAQERVFKDTLIVSKTIIHISNPSIAVRPTSIRLRELRRLTT